MRLGKLAMAVLAAGVLAGCGDNPSPKATRPPADGDAWVVVEPGRPTPSAGPRRGSPRPPLPPVSYLPTGPAACAMAWPQDDLVLIPLIVTPVAGGFRVEWPASYGPTYRLMAVHQDLVAGAQPVPPWQTAKARGNCSVTATITGLTSGEPYIVFLDAPETPRDLDGSRSLYSGRSRIVKPL
jgi:hypothetical protein